MSRCARSLPPARWLPAIFATLCLCASAEAQPLFTSSFRSFPTGDGPVEVTAGDLNGDGKQDLIVANYLGNNVSVLLGDGAGGFGAPNNLDTGLNPSWVEVADLDGDGRLDIVTANSGDGSVSVILRTGSGGYQPKEDYSLGGGTWGAAVGDFAGNTRPDIAAASDGNVALLVNAGNGTFGTPTTLAGDGASSVRLFDLNADTKLDLLTANFSGTSAISVRLWTGGPGVFGVRSDYSVGQTNDVTAGDVTGDGIVDLVSATWTDPGNIFVLPGIGGGAFGTRADYPCGGYPSAVALADLDGDTDLDVIVVDSYEHFVTTYPNLAGPSLGTRRDFEAGHAPYGLEVRDVNGDSKPDAIAACSFTDVVAVLFGNGAGGFGNETSYPLPAGPHLVTLADLNNDARLDAAVAVISSGIVSVRLQLANGTFGPASNLAAGVAVAQVAAGDLNADGKPDLAATDTLSNYLSVFLGNGDGTFAPRVTYATRPSPGGVVIADVTGDGKADVITTNRSGDDVSVFPGDGSGALGARADHPVGLNPFALAIADLNGDLRQDLVVACRSGGGEVRVMLGTGGGSFAAPVAYAIGRRVQSVALGHLNGDALLDLVVTSHFDYPEFNENFLKILLGTGTGAFLPPSEIATTTHPYSVAIHDVDGDGRSDLIVSGTTINAVAVHRGLGDGTFLPRVEFGAEDDPTGLAVGDVTGDGRPDLVTADYRANTLVVLRNLLPAILPPPTVSTMAPSAGGNNGSVTVRIAGANFQIGAIVRLSSMTQPLITASPVQVAADGRSIQATFNLVAKASGLRTLEVQNPDGGIGTLGGFNVTTGTGAPLSIQVVGPSRARAGRPRSFDLFFNNAGNVDAAGVPLWITGLPPSATLTWDPTPGAVSSLGGEPDWSTVPATFSGYSGNAAVQLLSRIPPGLSSRRLRIETPPGFSGVFTLETSLARGWPNTSGYRNCMDSNSPSVGPINIANVACMGAQLDAIRAALLAAPGVSTVNGIGVWAAIADRCEGVNGLGPSLAEAEAALDYMAYTIEFNTLQPECSDLLEFTQDTIRVNVGSSEDPNDKLGPSGSGAARYVGSGPMPYTIRFENLETAGADAQDIVIRDTLDAGLDPVSFEFGPILFGAHVVTPPPGLAPFEAIVDLRPARNVLVVVTAGFAPGTRVATWRLRAIDPDTGEPPPVDGFLPPNVTPPEGEGRVLYVAAPLPTLTTGAEIRNRAAIVFDEQAPVLTPQWLNTLDRTAPVSAVTPLAPVQSGTPFVLAWSGSDAGAGVRTYDILVSVDGGPYVTWLSGADTTAALFHGQSGHSFSFYSIATDRAGNREGAPLAADASTSVAGPLAVGVEPLGFALEGPVQNPSPRSLAVAFSLPGSTPAALELFDVAGRRVLRHDVGGLGAGRHVVPLGAGRRLAAGLYLIRLVRGNEALSARVVVLD